MSQYPPAYSPGTMPYYPTPGWDPGAALLAPARRAGVLLIVVGVLTLLYGLMNMGFGLSDEVFDALVQGPAAEMFTELESQTGLDTDDMRKLFVVVGGVLAGAGLALVVLGLFCRGGGAGAVITSLVVTALLLLGTGVVGLGNLLGVVGGQFQAIVGCCMAAVFAGLLILALVWLGQAARNAGHLTQWAAYQQQYAAYVQQAGGQAPWPPGAIPGWGQPPAPPPGAGPVQLPGQYPQPPQW